MCFIFQSTRYLFKLQSFIKGEQPKLYNCFSLILRILQNQWELWQSRICFHVVCYNIIQQFFLFLFSICLFVISKYKGCRFLLLFVQVISFKKISPYVCFICFRFSCALFSPSSRGLRNFLKKFSVHPPRWLWRRECDSNYTQNGK